MTNRILWAIALVIAGVAQAAVTVTSANFPVRQIAQDGNLYGQGEVGIYVSVPAAGTYTFTLNAYGTPAGGVYPVVGLSLDTLVKQTQTVSVQGNYTYTGALTAGVHQVGWWLHNDAAIDGQDRNVYITSMSIAPPAGGAEVSVSTRAAWVTAAQARENQAVADSAAAIETYRKGPATVRVVNTQGQVVSGATVQIEQLTHAFRFGASTGSLSSFPTQAQNDTYANKFKAVFNYGTIPLYWSYVEPVKGYPTYTNMDYQVSWCQANNIRMKGHAILWAFAPAIPSWMNGILPTQQEQLDHVAAVMGHFTAIPSWEVVNEAFNEPGLAFSAAQAKARTIQPGAELIANDYGAFYNGYPEWYAYLQQNIAAGVPIDAVGFQSHGPLDAAFPMDRVRDVLARYATLGKPIHITEFTPSSGGYAVTGNAWRTVWDEATQADYADDFYRVCFASPGVEAISWWDVTDVNSWCPQGGLLRSDLTSKPAYDKLNALINTEWHTRLNGSSNTTGEYGFRGFYGKHRVTVSLAGATTQTVDVNLVKGGTNIFVVTLDTGPKTTPTPTVTVMKLVTKKTTPTVTGSCSNATSVSAKVNGKTYNATISGTTWSVAVTTALTAGIYDVQATATGTGGSTLDSTTGELTIDLTVPVITLVGSTTVSVTKGTTYTDAGATATDNIDGNITSRIVKTSTVNTAVIGTYYVRYNVTDTAGNAATQKTRTVYVR